MGSGTNTFCPHVPSIFWFLNQTISYTQHTTQGRGGGGWNAQSHIRVRQCGVRYLGPYLVPPHPAPHADNFQLTMPIGGELLRITHQGIGDQIPCMIQSPCQPLF